MNGTAIPQFGIPRYLTYGRLVFVAAYTFLCAAAVFFLIRGAGFIAGVVLGSGHFVAAALSQLSDARVDVPLPIPLCAGVVFCIVWVAARRPGGNKAVAAFCRAAFFIGITAAFIATLLTTRVNGVLVYVFIDLLRMLFASGVV
jgi:hypothetical protein